MFVGESLPLLNNWCRWSQNTSDQWVRAGLACIGVCGTHF